MKDCLRCPVQKRLPTSEACVAKAESEVRFNEFLQIAATAIIKSGLHQSEDPVKAALASRVLDSYATGPLHSEEFLTAYQPDSEVQPIIDEMSSIIHAFCRSGVYVWSDKTPSITEERCGSDAIGYRDDGAYYLEEPDAMPALLVT